MKTTEERRSKAEEAALERTILSEPKESSSSAGFISARCSLRTPAQLNPADDFAALGQRHTSRLLRRTSTISSQRPPPLPPCDPIGFNQSLSKHVAPMHIVTFACKSGLILSRFIYNDNECISDSCTALAAIITQAGLCLSFAVISLSRLELESAADDDGRARGHGKANIASGS